jgi:hypothetical protein
VIEILLVSLIEALGSHQHGGPSYRSFGGLTKSAEDIENEIKAH